VFVGFGQVLLQPPQVVVRQHDGMPAVGLDHSYSLNCMRS
jgi:hypothetical protein